MSRIIFSRITLKSRYSIHLTHWGRVTHTCICVGKLTIIGSDNGLSPDRRQAIIWTNAGKLLIGPLGTNFNENLIGIQTFSFYKMHFKMSSAKWRPFCLGLNVLNGIQTGSCLQQVVRSHGLWKDVLVLDYLTVQHKRTLANFRKYISCDKCHSLRQCTGGIKVNDMDRMPQEEIINVHGQRPRQIRTWISNYIAMFSWGMIFIVH